MPTFTTWYVTVILQVARKQQTITGPGRDTEEEVKADLKERRHRVPGGELVPEGILSRRQYLWPLGAK